MRKILWLLGVLVLSCFSPAQTTPSSQSSWANLNALQTGNKIQVLDAASKKHTGVFVSVSSTAIILREAAGEQSIPQEDVRRVQRFGNKYRLRNAVIGGAAGAGVVAVIGAATLRPCQSGGFCLISKSQVIGLGAAMGAIVGAIVGAVLPSHSTIYRASSKQLSSSSKP